MKIVFGPSPYKSGGATSNILCHPIVYGPNADIALVWWFLANTFAMGEGFTTEETYDLEGGNEGAMAFSDKSVRRGFIKKVYAIISVQVRLDQNRTPR